MQTYYSGFDIAESLGGITCIVQNGFYVLAYIMLLNFFFNLGIMLKRYYTLDRDLFIIHKYRPVLMSAFRELEYHEGEYEDLKSEIKSLLTVNFDSLNYKEMTSMSEKYQMAGERVKEFFVGDLLEGEQIFVSETVKAAEKSKEDIVFAEIERKM